MSTPSGQLLPATDLKRIQNLRSQHNKNKASKEEMGQYNQMKEEILQFMLLKKQKVHTVANHKTSINFQNLNQNAANDLYTPLQHSPRNTYLVD